MLLSDGSFVWTYDSFPSYKINFKHLFHIFLSEVEQHHEGKKDKETNVNAHTTQFDIGNTLLLYILFYF
jgi:hypothetical protein